MKIRDKETFILFVAGTSLSFFIVINGIQLMNGWMNQIRHGQEERQYSSAVEFKVMRWAEDDPHWEEGLTMMDEEWERELLVRKKDVAQLMKLLMEQGENVYLRTGAAIGRSVRDEPVDVVVAGTGGWYRTLRSGQYPEGLEWQGSDGCVYLSEAAEQLYAEWIDGQEVLRIAGNVYPVMGIFENYRMSDQLSGENIEICLYYVPKEGDDIYDRWASCLQYGEIWIVLGSDRTDVGAAADALMSEIEAELGYVTAVVEGDTSGALSGSEQFYARMKSVVLLLLFVVSLLNCRQITALWIRRRQKELVIAKAFGMNDRQLLLWMLGELAGMLGISLAAVLCINGVYLLISRSSMDIRLALQDAGLLAGAFLIMMAVTILPVLGRIQSVAPAQGLRGD